MQRFYVALDREEALAILRLAEREKRHPRDQAAMLIRSELRRRKLLPHGKDTRGTAQ